MTATALSLSGDVATVYNFLASGGDASGLTQQQRNAYYAYRCELAGLDPATVPFQWLKLQGKLILYAVKGCTDQLAGKHRVHLQVLSQVTEEQADGPALRIVTVRATTADGRATDEVGIVPLTGTGEVRSNAMLKAVTKAKRRAVLSLLGLGMLDEMEVETIPGARVLDETKPSLPAPASEKPAPAPAAATADKPPRIGPVSISEPQLRRLHTLATKSGKSTEEIKRHLAEFYGLESSRGILVKDYEVICAWVTGEWQEKQEPPEGQREPGEDEAGIGPIPM